MEAYIFKAEKTAMQSGRGAQTGRCWCLELRYCVGAPSEPLMGWTSGKDTNNQVRLRFSTQKEAQAFANARGWRYKVLPPQERKIIPRNYADNFRYQSPELAEKEKKTEKKRKRPRSSTG